VTDANRPPDDEAKPAPMKPPRPASSEGRTQVDPRPPFEATEEVTLEYRPDQLPPDILRKASGRLLSIGKREAPLEADVTLEYRPGQDKGSSAEQPELKLNPMPYGLSHTQDRGLQTAEPGPRYVELGPERHFEETPYDLAVPQAFSEVIPEPAPELVEESPLRPEPVPPPKPVIIHPPALPVRHVAERLVRSELTPEGDIADEYHPPLSDPVSASEITKLPDVKRALDALRAGKMMRPPGASPYAAPAPDSKSTLTDRGTPSSSRPRTPAGRSTDSAPAARRSTESSLQRVRVAPMVIGILGWLVAAALVLVFARGRGQPALATSAAPPPVSAVPPQLVSPKPAADSALDPMAVQKIAETPVGALTPEQWVTLARERNRKRSQELRELAARIHADQPASQETIARLRDTVRDPVTAPDALMAMASLGGPTGPDLIYQVANDEHLPAETRGLGLDLLGTPLVRTRASEALGVVLDLGRTKTCEDVAQIVERAAKVADRRAVTALGKLSSTRGCGANKANDCYPCLRKNNRLNSAIEAARGRQAPP
jgi:hypothetical protein